MVKLRTRLIIVIAPLLIFTLLLSYLGSLRVATLHLNREIDERVNSEAKLQKAELEKNLNIAKQVSNDLSAVISNTFQLIELEEYIAIMHSIVSKNQFVLGTGIWFEPYAYDESAMYLGPYVYKSGSKIITTYEYSNENYDYFKQDYYSKAKELMRMNFTDIYYDDTSGLYMMTCSQPIVDSDNKFVGCVTVDIEMFTLQKFVTEYNATHNAKASIVSKEGKYLACEDTELVKNSGGIGDVYDFESKQLSSEIIHKSDGMVQGIKAGEKVNIYYVTLNELGWKMIIEITENEINAPLKVLSEVFLIIFGASIVLLIAAIYMISDRSIDRPVQAIIRELNIIGDDLYLQDIDAKLMNRKDEFGFIGRALQKMKERVQLYQAEIKNTLEENVAANEELTQQNEELIETEKRLSDSLQYSTALVEAIPDTVFVLSGEDEFLDCKGDLKSLFFDKNLFLGKKIIEIMPHDIAVRAIDLIREARRTGDIQKMEYEWINQEEKEYHELRIVNWFDDKVLAIARNITEMHNYMKQIEFASYHDQLTGLLNRRYYDLKLSQLFVVENYPIAIVVSDLNGLKMINDSFGHEYGNQMIQEYAKILSDKAQDNMKVIRMGGDEFISILLRAKDTSAQTYISELIDLCSQVRIGGVDISVSFGVSIMNDTEASLQEEIKKAEDQMYQDKLYESSSRRNRTVDIILSTLHEKNPREEMHSRRVAELCELLANAMGMPEKEIKKLKTAAILHDIGKIGIPEELLNKPGKLSREEYIEITKHAEIGFRILNAAPNMTEIAEIVLAHHERWDGEGYPRGIAGEMIPFSSRIISIADTYDAITSERSYRKALSSEFALNELKNSAGTQFDPKLVDIFLEIITS